MKNIENHFKMAEETLEIKHPALTSWTDKVSVIPNTPLLAPKVDPEVLEKVYEALFLGKAINVSWYQKGKEQPYSFEANPLGIVFRNYKIYLICTTSENDFEIVQYKPLHRIMEVEILDKAVITPEDFNLQEYINDEKELSWKLTDELLNFKGRFNSSISYILYETPLSEGQTITRLDNGDVVVEAKVPDTYQFRWWLLNLGEKVKIIKPRSLYFEFKKTANELSEIYKLKPRNSKAISINNLF